jgi:anti-sigma regulatory factor (Ser/Thr protein kinase)
MSTQEKLPPNYGKLDTALRSIGYSFEVAVADIVDNAIDATRGKRNANVLVRLVIGKDGRIDVAVWDNGSGMDAARLKEAMRFGADVSSEIERLGKFGLGLKLASLSQAKEVHVVTFRDGRFSGRAWLEQGISEGFSSTVYDATECRSLIANVVPDQSLEPSGTVVWWSGLYRDRQFHADPEEHAQKLMRRLENHLALAFHRFLTGRPRKVAISLDIFNRTTGTRGIPIDLDPLDPFNYGQSGRTGFPAVLALSGEYANRISLRAHIWPPNSTSPGYRLPGGANSRQGFYFYRNNRLIQAGGWNGMREPEPHLSLARVEADLSPELDLTVSLDVRKVEIQLPLELVSAIEKAKTQEGVDFKKYLSFAQESYRKRTITTSELPLIPSQGLPSQLATFLHRELRIKATAKHRDLKIRWKRLEKDRFFDLDRDGGHLYLNRSFRKRLLHGLPGSAADLPVLKCLLFLVAEEALSSERMGARMRERLEQVNRILVRAVKFERAE